MINFLFICSAYNHKVLIAPGTGVNPSLGLLFPSCKNAISEEVNRDEYSRFWEELYNDL